MRWHLSILPAAALLAGALALPTTRNIAPVGREPFARPLEVARLQAHFDSVGAELRQARVRHLTDGQRTGRLTLLRWLREYREAGRFPRNDRFPGLAMPFFRDSGGTLCAMAYLIDRSGRGDLVDRIALTRNNAFIAELAHDSDLRAWLDSVGLTATEAARIQPQYGGVTEDRVSDEYAITSILVSGTSLATLGLNLFAPSETTGWAGLLAGGVGVIAGAVRIDDNDGIQNVAAVNLLIGAGAMVAGLFRVLPRAERRAAVQSSQSPHGATLALVPQVIPSSSGTRLGLAMHARF